MRNINTPHLTNCCVITIEKDRMGVVERGRVPQYVEWGSWTVLEPLPHPGNVWREGSFQRCDVYVQFKGRLTGKRATDGRPAPLPKPEEAVCSELKCKEVVS